MLWISDILAQLIREYIDSVSQPAGEYRLVIPGLTARIGEELHDKLRSQKINSFFVIAKTRVPDEARRWLLPASLTTMRIGSFVAIADPGALSDIQDSIRGSGGAIRGAAFSEEWPWIENGSEAFHFIEKFLPRLLDEWSTDTQVKRWLNKLISNELLLCTRVDRDRAGIFLEKILGSFDPALPSQLKTVNERFLFHCGIPAPLIADETPSVIAKDTRSLVRKIIERSKGEPRLRKQVIDNINPNDANAPDVEFAINMFFDGLSNVSSLDGDILALQHCWGTLDKRLQNWQCLTSDKLKKLFEFQEQGQVELSCTFAPGSSVLISDDERIAVGPSNETYLINVRYDIPVDEFSDTNSYLVLSIRNHKEEPRLLASPLGSLSIPLNIEDTGVSYRGRISVKVAILVDEDIRSEGRLIIHCHGEQRPEVVVITPDFWVEDADKISPDDVSPERKHLVEGPVKLHLFTSTGIQPSVTCDGSDEQLVQNNNIWRTANDLNVFGHAASQATYLCQFEKRSVSLEFQAKDVERGEFTLEDELRELQVFAKKDRLRDVLAIHTGHSTEPYSYLGGITDQTRRRTRLARYFELRDGWKPVLADLLELADKTDEACGEFARTIGRSNASAIASAKLPNEALEILRTYRDKRDLFRQVVVEKLQASAILQEYPEYAVYPIYLAEESEQRQTLELALVNYLLAYTKVQTYLQDNLKALDWPQSFVLNYLDCIIQWRDGASKNSFFLLGPWHPLVVAKRFMVQRALVLRAKRMIDGQDKEFHELVALLSQVNGFHWHPGLNANDAAFEPAYVCPTSDPGWHFAFKKDTTVGNMDGGSTTLLDDALREIRESLGLEARIHLPASGAMVGSVLSSYMRTFPSKRHVGVYFPNGFRGEEEVVTADKFLHTADGSTQQAGLRFPGGVSLLFENTPCFPEDVMWTGPPLKVFKYDKWSQCVTEQHPDIQFCQAGNRSDFIELTNVSTLPRGKDYGTVFSQSLSRLAHGQTSIPKSILEEWDLQAERGESIGDLFARNCELACALAGRPQGIVQNTSLPLRQETAWTVVPGTVLDPAVFVQYVGDGKEQHMEERSLWDYRVSLSGASTSFFILSTIPSAFRSAVNGVFGTTDDHASTFVTELGQIGLAIAGEAMKSGRHALGSVGVVGAVRLFIGHTKGVAPLRWTRKSIGFLLPVDSFRDILEGGAASIGQRDTNEAHRRADLLAVVLQLPSTAQSPLIIQSASIECKFSSTTFPDAQVQPALEQSRATTDQFQRLCKAAQAESGMAERLALLQLVRFGIRITRAYEQGDSPERLSIEKLIYEKLLRGEFEYRPAKTSAILVSTELALHGVAEHSHLATGLWIRVNQNNWPGIAETPSIASIRQIVMEIFDIGSESSSPTLDAVGKVSATDMRDIHVEPIGPSPVRPESLVETDPLPSVTTNELDVSVVIVQPITDAPMQNEAQLNLGVELRKILVGVDSSRRSSYFDPHSPLDRLDNANVMITGSSGKGKTQLLKYMIRRIREQGANALVLDFKNDFASDAHFTESAKLLPILVTFDGMPFNPLIPYPIRDPRTGKLLIQCAQHIAGISSVLRRTYGLGAQQEANVKNAIRQAFADCGIDPATTVSYNPATKFPDFSRVGQILEQTNRAAYNRLDPLFTLGLFRDKYSAFSFAEMVEQSAAIDFSKILSDALKNALAELVVLSAHSYFNSQPHSGKLRQVFIVDEAHRILNADYMERFALECRAYGVSLMLSSQYPSHFPSGISSSLATKIIHGNDRDVGRVRDIVDLLGYPNRESQIADLGMFEAIFSNKHFPGGLLRTIPYAVYLVLVALQKCNAMSHEEISKIDGIDTTKLSVGNIVQQLERLGLCESVNGRVRLISREI